MVTNAEFAEWFPNMLVSELDETYRREAETERLLRQPEMLSRLEQQLGIHFAREVN